jgi:hypothetical protein
MANPHRGQVEIEADGQTWTVRFDVNTVCEIESLLGLSITEILSRIERAGGQPSMSVCRALFWGGLRDAHPDIDLKQAGRIMTGMDLPELNEKINEALELAFPEPPPDAAKKNRRAKSRRR